MSLTPDQKTAIRAAISARYARVAACPGRGFKYPTGGPGLSGLGYGPELLKDVPAQSTDFFCGVGNPFSLGGIQSGQTVLDVGCGAGTDAFVAAGMAGESGLVVGLDPSPDMLDRARDALTAWGRGRVFFLQGDAEDIPLAQSCADVILSNGAMNLVVDKDRALAGMWRVLRPGGAVFVADQILVSEPSACPLDPARSWFR
jgi:SAM-dependent methyltransferase